MRQVETEIDGKSVDELKGWCSLWSDLLLAGQSLEDRSNQPEDLSGVFSRRALWEAALVAYGRTANSGRRAERVGSLLDEAGREAAALHDRLMRLRDKHAAHRVDQSLETVAVTAVLDADTRRIERLHVKVTPFAGPFEDEGLAEAFAAHVQALRELVWGKHIRPLETRIVDGLRDEESELLKRAVPIDRSADRDFSISFDPSGPLN